MTRRGPDIDWSRKPRSSKPPYSPHKLRLLLTDVRWRDGIAWLRFEGPDWLPFEIPGGDERRGIFRTELLKAGVFRLPLQLRRPATNRKMESAP